MDAAAQMRGGAYSPKTCKDYKHNQSTRESKI